MEKYGPDHLYIVELQKEITNKIIALIESNNENNKELNEKIGKWITKTELTEQSLKQLHKEITELRLDVEKIRLEFEKDKEEDQKKEKKNLENTTKLKEKISFWDWFLKFLIGGIGGLLGYFFTQLLNNK